ncbi:hypothetical protein [Sandaracinus amylolyticus]|uniref:hypothetical protein n=1 Tax=Sandaracinus amylolyticus TaxID=927083 RepID=UPI001F27F0F9|nr:hypothetical protein [Sandaracinus amylolyticus]UJR84802.1 Hypothetical protein I5071_68810 [Sandaracinus amylolyticus]
MDRNNSRVLAAAALCVAALSFAPRTAHAYDVNGLGVGADVSLGGPSGFALSLGLGRLELDFILGLSLNLPEGGVLTPTFGGAAGVFYTLTDATQTNLQIGGRIGVLVDSQSVGGELDTNAAFTIEADLRVEHRLDDHCVINFQVGIGTQIWPDDPDIGTAQSDFVMGFGNTGLVGGAGFRYYFEPLGTAPAYTPAPAASAPPPPATQSSVEPAATPTTGEDRPDWE